MTKSDAYQKLLREAFKELSALEMIEHLKWELDYFYKNAKEVSDDSKQAKTP